MKKIRNIHFNYLITTSVVILLCGILLGGCNGSMNVSTTPESTIAIEEMNTISSDETESIADTTIQEETTEAETVPETTTALNYDELIDFDAKLPYLIRINKTHNWTIIYGMDKDGHYSIPYKIFVCSTGLNEGDTPTGSFRLGQKYDWRLMVDGSYAQYAIRIHGPIMLHSVPYYSANKDDLEVKEYKKLGQPASLGCIRYAAADIKWIYDNCPDDTIVVIYNSEEEVAPLEIPEVKKATSKGKKAGWDPTDPDKKNPWNKKSKKQK